MELFVIVVFLTVTGAQQSQLEGPENTMSVVGSSVTLKCSPPPRNCNGIDWQKYVRGASPMTIFKNSRLLIVVDKDRYSVDNSSGCDLVIKNAQLKDAGRFICSAIMSLDHVTKTAHLIILETQPKCTLNVSLRDTVEGDGVQLNCAVSFNGTNGVSFSMNWKGVTDAPAAVKTGSTINRSHSVVASAPEVPSFTCETSFTLELNDSHGQPIVGVSTNKIPNANCSTSAIRVLYSVRNVSLSPTLSYYSPRSVINCTAKGHPSPTFKWQEMGNGGTWIDNQNQHGSEFTMKDVSSKRYRCVAMNAVRNKNYNATSNEIPANNTESDYDVSDSPAPETNYIVKYTMMTAAVGILLLIILLIVCFCTKSCPGYKFYNSGNKSDDNLRDEHPRRENPDVIYSVVNKGQDSHPKSTSPKRPKYPPPQPNAGHTDAYQYEDVTYADLAMECDPRKVVPRNHGQAAQEESLYAAVSVA